MSRSGVLSRQSRPTTESLLPSMRSKPRHRGRDRIGPRRRAQRKGAAALGVMPRRLQHQVAPRFVHPVEQQHVADGFEAGKAFGPKRIDLHGADGVGLARIFRAVLAPLPRRADTADIIERGIEGLRQRNRDFALAQAVPVVVRRHVARRIFGFGRVDHSGKMACVLASRQTAGGNHSHGAKSHRLLGACPVWLNDIKISLYAMPIG